MDEASKTAGQDAAKAPAYRVLARKYRPTDFSQLIGQEPMVRTLTNAFETGRIAQAWMLTGVRGVGKTTTARILARALNYKTSEIDRPTVDMTVEGENCRAIMEGRHVDVIEMDAASHTGIDDIRDIIDRVRYAPVSARYKVYIIDEVHMLSTQAFNGLLKTLEEPPPHVKFIFATTEIRKVPITVLSRCQRFDLRRIDAGMIRDDLKRIAGLEGVTVDDEALSMVARAAEGSMRDAQSIFDQAIAHGSGNVTAEAVRDMLGVADRTRVIDLFEAVMRGDAAAALKEYRVQYDTGADPVAVLTDLAEFTHLVTRLRFIPEAASDASLSEAERRRGQEFAASVPVRVLSRAWQMLLKGIPEVQTSNRPVSAGEMVLIRLAHAADLPTLDEALRSLDGGTVTAAAPKVSQSQPTSQTPLQSAPIPAGQPRNLTTTASAAPAPVMRVVEAEPAPEIAVRSVADIANLADQHRDMQFKILVRNYVRPVKIEPGKLEIALTDDAPKTFVNDLSARLKNWTGRQWFVSLSREEGAPTMAQAESAKRQDAITDAKNDPDIAAILSRFPGSRITDIRIPEAQADATDEALEAASPPPEDDTN